MSNAGEVRKLKKIMRRIKALKGVMENKTDEELKAMTEVFKERYEKGESLDKMLPEAFAVMCEADYRVLGKFPYDVQIMGGIALHKGFLAEMNTGEGKTLTATMPLYLNAITGKSTMLVTTNEYLALRDAEEMGEVYGFMGLKCMAGVKIDASDRFTNEEKKEIYDSDIVYTTHSILGFDYLLNNLVKSADERFMREFYYIIIDEADSVLLDSAQTPLVISGSPRVQSNLYEMTDFFVSTLEEGTDYETEEKKVWLTAKGVERAEYFFGIDNFYDRKHFEINRHVILALRARVLFNPEKEYVINDKGELVLLDSDSGRMMPGVKLRGGQHQAIEMKEKIKITQENRSVASITYQNLFLLFPKMSGMSGTILDAKDEIFDIYSTRVLVIPPNHKVIRRDMPDVFYKDTETQISDAVRAVCAIHKSGQPVLVVAGTIAETEVVSRLLIEENIPHNVLNANNVFWEAAIIAEAGQMNAVTVATSIVGRGTDIKLGEGVKQLGGLAVIGIGRMTNIRQERQARGRAGRQGDPGYSRFFVSLEDDVVVNYGPENLEKLFKKKGRLRGLKVKRMINNAQKVGEEFASLARKRAMEYDQVLQKQRTLMYEVRNRLIDGGSLENDEILGIAEINIDRFIKEEKPQDISEVERYILDNISYSLPKGIAGWDVKNKKQLKECLLKTAQRALNEKEKKLEWRNDIKEYIRLSSLAAVDDAWVEQVDYLQQLQGAVAGRASAQRNLVFEYQKEAYDSFEEMEKSILNGIVRNIMLANTQYDEEGQMSLVLP